MAADRLIPTSPPANTTMAYFAGEVQEELTFAWLGIPADLTGVAGTNNVTASCTAPITSYGVVNNFMMRPTMTNTGPMTLNIDGVGARALTKADGSALAAGDVVAGSSLLIRFDQPSGAFRIVGGVANGQAVVYGNAAELAAGTDNVKVYTANTIASGSVKTFGSAADDGKLVKVTNTGKIDLSLLPISSALVYRGNIAPASAAPASPAVGDVYLLSAAGAFGASWGVLNGQTGAVGDQLIYDGTKWNLVSSSSNFGTSADLIAGTDTSKVYHAAAIAGASTATSAGAADAGKLVKLDAAGQIDASALPVNTMQYKGAVSAAAAAPASPVAGHVYSVSAAGTFPASWGGLSGQKGFVGDQVLYTGAGWLRTAAGLPAPNAQWDVLQANAGLNWVANNEIFSGNF